MQDETFPFSGSTYLGPDPRFAHWRRASPVVRVPLRGGGHAWLVTRYSDVKAAAADPRLSRAAAYRPGAPSFEGLFQPPPGMIASLDPPEHTRLRHLAEQAFSRERIEGMRPRITRLAGELIDGWIGKPPPVDLMEHFATPLALTVICELLGAPLADREKFRAWVRQLAVVDGAAQAAAQGRQALGEYIAGLVAAKRKHPGDDVLSALAGTGDLSDQELVVFGWTLLGAGFDTTAGQIGLSVLALLARYPEQWRRLVRYPEEIPSTVEELLRGVNIHRSDTSGLARIATTDLTIAGQAIPAGDAVFLAFTSANHDESAFVDAHRLDFTRDDPHFAFGGGIHECLGASLARLELAVALECLTQRLPALRLAVPEHELRWRDGDVNHTLMQLPVTYPSTKETRMTTNTEVHLVAYPGDVVSPEHFTVAQTELKQPGPGQVLVRNEFMTLAAAYRDQMMPATTIPIPVFQLGQPMWGRTVGTVVQSNSPELAVGDLVEHFYGWRDYATGTPAEFHKRDRDLLPSPEYFLSQGPTAWRGMVEMAGVGDGDVVFVSGATSGVGSLAGQIAKARGAKRVIGSTGSKSKAGYLVDECGFDAVLDYHDDPVADQLRELAPDGISVFFDNVGGEQFEAAVAVAAPFARFALCGALSGQLDKASDGARPRLDLMAALPKQLILRPFATYHTPEQIADWNKQFSTWLRESRITFPHTIVPGTVADLPKHFVSLLERKFSGNVIAKLS